MKDTQPAFTRLYQSALCAYLSGRTHPDPITIANISRKIFMLAFTKRTGVRTHLTVFKGGEKLSDVKRTVIYCGAQEAINNVGRHARAERSEVRIPISKSTERRWLDEPVEISPEIP